MTVAAIASTADLGHMPFRLASHSTEPSAWRQWLKLLLG